MEASAVQVRACSTAAIMSVPYEQLSEEKGEASTESPALVLDVKPSSEETTGLHSQVEAPVQTAYPPQSVDTGAAYPTQYPGYPPPQPYFPSPPPGYQPVPAYLQGGAPYSQQQQQQQQNVTVVTQQPQPEVLIQQPPGRPELGIGAIVFAIVTTVILAILGCWWSLPFTVVGIILAATATTTGESGNVGSAKTQAGISIGCTVFGWVFSVMGIVVFVIVIISVTQSKN